MENIRLLTEMLTTEHEYWVVAKRDEHQNGQRYKDQIFVTCIPTSIRRGLDRKEILLTDLEALREIYLPNIFLNMDYPPFQHGQSLWHCVEGFPLTGIDINKFIVDGLALESNEIYKYKELIDAQQPFEV